MLFPSLVQTCVHVCNDFVLRLPQKKLDRFLRDESLADRLYVVSKLAGIEQKLAGREKKRLVSNTL